MKYSSLIGEHCPVSTS